MQEIPFNPLPPGWEGHPMPPSVPTGMQLRLSRAKVIPGQEDQAEAWMEMLHRRYDEAVATLPRERAAFESIFFSGEPDGSMWLYHLELFGDAGGGLDPEGSDVDREHIEYGRRVKLPGWRNWSPGSCWRPTISATPSSAGAWTGLSSPLPRAGPFPCTEPRSRSRLVEAAAARPFDKLRTRPGQAEGHAQGTRKGPGGLPGPFRWN